MQKIQRETRNIMLEDTKNYIIRLLNDAVFNYPSIKVFDPCSLTQEAGYYVSVDTEEQTIQIAEYVELHSGRMVLEKVQDIPELSFDYDLDICNEFNRDLLFCWLYTFADYHRIISVSDYDLRKYILRGLDVSIYYYPDEPPTDWFNNKNTTVKGTVDGYKLYKYKDYGFVKKMDKHSYQDWELDLTFEEECFYLNLTMHKDKHFSDITWKLSRC